MTVLELRDLVIGKLRGNGVLSALHHELSQFLDVSEGLFVEVVLTDASRIPEALRAMDEVIVELQKQHVSLQHVVRAIWQVDSVENKGVAYGSQGVPKSAVSFAVRLSSGNRQTVVRVDVSVMALDGLKTALGIGEGSGAWESVGAPVLNSLVRDYVEYQLGEGGLSYWDPIKFPVRDLSAAGMSYLLHKRRESLPIGVGPKA